LESDDVAVKTATVETAANILTDVYEALVKDTDNSIDSLCKLLETTHIASELSITKRGQKKLYIEDKYIKCL
jgi:hypothetical protein